MRLKKFIGHTSSFYRMAFLALMLASIYACNKDSVTGPATSLTEMRSAITLVHADTSLVLRWSPGVAAWEGDDRQTTVSYQIQVSADPTFSDESQHALDLETDSTWIFLGDEEIVPLQQYFARVRTVASTGTGSSGWMRTSSFQLKPIDLFRPIKVWSLTDEAAILGWATHGELTTLVVETAEGTNKQEFDVRDDKMVSKLIEGLSSGKNYVARLFRHDDRPLGVLEFTTKPTVEQAGYIDLRTSSDPMILQNTLNTVPAGSTIALKRGMTYTITETFKLDRDVTITSEPGFGNQARIQMSSSFDVAEGSQINLIKFEDVEITGDIGSTYAFNLSPASTIKKIEFEACRISDQRGVLRLKDAGVKTVTDYVINNSVVQNIGGYGMLTVDNEAAVVNSIRMTNSTFINAEWISRYGNGARNDLDLMLIENSTFFNAPYNNKYLIDMQRTGSTIGNVTVRNTLFGYTAGARSFNRFVPNSTSVTNSFATSDSKWGSSSSQALIQGIVGYSASSEQVFARPDMTNFANSDLTITDEALFTVGDPRWRP